MKRNDTTATAKDMKYVQQKEYTNKSEKNKTILYGYYLHACLSNFWKLISKHKYAWLHINASQVGNILYLDTKCFTNEDSTLT